MSLLAPLKSRQHCDWPPISTQKLQTFNVSSAFDELDRYQHKTKNCLLGYLTTKMVRIKERYLLVNIIYPDASRDASKLNLPDLLVYNQPTSDTFNGRTFSQAIKAEVANLFGDYGAGTVERTLRSMFFFSFYPFKSLLYCTLLSTCCS